MTTRTVVYIDGFNLYHAIDDLKQNHFKWLDLWALSETLLQNEQTLVGVKYFTAYATWREDSFKRHEKYIAALEAKGVTPIIGKFKKKWVYCKATCKEKYTTHEEKETDVNIGVHLVADALSDRFDRALIITADTDLNAAVKLARQEAANKQILLVAPPGRKRRNTMTSFEITRGRIKQSLLPEQIKTEKGLIHRPQKYTPPQT